MGYRKRGYRPRRHRRHRRQFLRYEPPERYEPPVRHKSPERQGLGVPSVEYKRYGQERRPSSLHQLRQRAGQALGQGRQTVESLWGGYQSYREERKARKRFAREEHIGDLTLEARERDLEARIRAASMRGHPRRAPLPPLSGQRHGFGMQKFLQGDSGFSTMGLNKFINAERQAQATVPKKKKKKGRKVVVYLDED